MEPHLLIPYHAALVVCRAQVFCFPGYTSMKPEEELSECTWIARKLIEGPYKVFSRNFLST